MGGKHHMQSGMVRKGLVVGIIVLFLVVCVPPNVSAEGKPDLKVLEMAIDYQDYAHFPGLYMVINCKIENIGDASATYLGVHGTIERVFCKFLSEGECNSGQSYSLGPGGVKWITVVEFPSYGYFKFIDYGLFQINITVSTSDDANPENNIIDGKYLIFNEKIIPRI